MSLTTGKRVRPSRRLLAQIRHDLRVSPEQARRIVETIAELWKQALLEGKIVEMPGMWVFMTRREPWFELTRLGMKKRYRRGFHTHVFQTYQAAQLGKKRAFKKGLTASYPKRKSRYRRRNG